MQARDDIGMLVKHVALKGEQRTELPWFASPSDGWETARTT